MRWWLAVVMALAGTQAFCQEKADELIAAKHYVEAASWLEKFIKKSPEDAVAHEKLGDVYRQLREFKKAETMYEKAEIFSGLSPTGTLNYGLTLVKNGKSEEARKQFEYYQNTQPQSFVVKLLLQSMAEVKAWNSLPPSYEVHSVAGLNSPFSDFAPLAFGDKLVFASERNEDLVNDNFSAYNGRPYLGIFSAEFRDLKPTQTRAPKPFLSHLVADYHIGPASIDTARNTIYFTETRSGKNDETVIESFSATIVNNKRIDAVVKLNFNDGYTIAHPSISPDGSTLFFASNRPGGQGGMDLYVVRKTESGWGAPENLGPNINTALNEVFPTATGAASLIFASDGHAGYGGLDLMKSNLVDGQWAKPLNLRAPINSTGDDFALSYTGENRGYFSSERDGGEGGDDIYYFVQLAEPDDNARTPVAGVFEYSNLPPEGISLSLLDENDNLIETVFTDSLGQFAFQNLPVNKDYRVEVSNATPDMMAEAKVFLLNSRGEKVLILDRLNEKTFAFKTLPSEQIEGLARLEETDTGLGDYELFGHVYSALSREAAKGIQIEVLDDNGTLVMETTTNTEGNYALEGLRKDRYYTVVAKGEVVYRSSVFYEDEKGIHPVMEQTNNLFLLKQLIAQQHRVPEPSVPAVGSVDVDGMPLINARLLLKNDSGEVVGAVRTDEKGHFNFGPVAPGMAYSVIVPDSVGQLNKKVNVFFENESGNSVALAERESKNTFSFKALERSAYAGERLETADSEVNYEVKGQVYEKLPGDFTDGLEIVAYDENGNEVERVMANASGQFQFNKLKPDVTYRFSTDDEDASTLNFALETADSAQTKVLRFDELNAFVFDKLQQEAALVDTSAVGDDAFVANNVAGQLYKRLPGDYTGGIAIYALNDEGVVIDSAFTDDQGNFRFTRLTRDESFKLTVMDESADNARISFENFDGHFTNDVGLDSADSYTYSKIILEAAAALAQLEEEDKAKAQVAGQIFKKLPGDYVNGIVVYALDDNGRLIDSAITDGNGNFKFYRLQNDGNYTLQVNESEEVDLNIAFFDYAGNYLKTVALEEERTVNLREEVLAANDQAVVIEATTENNRLTGQIYREQPGDYGSGTRIYAIDEAGNIIDAATLDEKGKFKFNRLSREQNYLIMLEETDAEANLALAGSEDEPVEKMEVNEGAWVFDKLKHESLLMSAIEEEDVALAGGDKWLEEQEVPAKPATEKPVVEKPKATPTPIGPASAGESIYFDFKKFDLGSDDLAALDAVLRKWQQNKTELLVIRSHSDASEGTTPTDLSARRSVAIANYFYQNGVPLDALRVANMDSAEPTNQCAPNCSEQERQKNQRSTVALVSPASQLPEPNYVLQYEFNQWNLPPDAGSAMSGLHRVLRENPTWRVRIDGYADAFGGGTENERISQLRGKNLYNYLIAKGVSPERLELIWHGESIPVGGCLLEYPCPVSERKSNRRVEIRLIP